MCVRAVSLTLHMPGSARWLNGSQTAGLTPGARCPSYPVPNDPVFSWVERARAPLILSASLPGAPVREVNSKGVVGQSTVPTGPQVGTDRPTTHLRPSTPQTTMGILVRHGWAGGFGHKLCPKSRGSPRAEAETTSQAATRRPPRLSFTWNARMCACMHTQLHTKVPDLTSDDTGSPPYGVCHHPLIDSDRYSS
jgi:hypothetical protein